jgi:hypothetical protein
MPVDDVCMRYARHEYPSEHNDYRGDNARSNFHFYVVADRMLPVCNIKLQYRNGRINYLRSNRLLYVAFLFMQTQDASQSKYKSVVWF